MSNEFFVVDIKYTHYQDTLDICIITNRRCHLTCYYTEQTPLHHRAARTLRGVTLPWGATWCFVAYKELEQSNPGDTLFHTFLFPAWAEGLTRWFTFAGYVGAEKSPSVGPIFEHTHPGGEPKDLIIRPNAPGDICSDRLTGTGSPCPLHWGTVASPPPHQDVFTLQGNTINQWFFHDLYHLPNTPLGAINKVTITSRCRRQGGYAYVTVAQHHLKTYGVVYSDFTFTCLDTWAYYTWELYNNPHTGQRWDQDEIDLLQIGIGLRLYRGVGWGAMGWCSELYLTVTRETECPTLPPWLYGV